MDQEIKQMLIATYNRYSGMREANALSEWKHVERLKLAERIIAEGKTSLLEIGAGTGKDCRYYEEQGFRVVATDLSPEMVRLCRKKGVPVARMDYYHLGFRADSFDSVRAMNSLLHAPKRRFPGILAEIRAVLKPDGLFYLGQWGGNGFEGIWEDDYYVPKRFFSFQCDEEITEAVGKWFEPVALRFFNPVGSKGHFQSMIWRKARKP